MPSLVAGILLFAAVVAWDGPPPRAKVVYTVASGESDAPPETTTLTWADGKGRLELKRPGFEGGPDVTDAADLTPQEFQALWALVVRHKLATLAPELSPGVAHDFGTRTLTVETASKPDMKADSHTAKWSRPLVNASGVAEYEKALGRLARAKLKTTPPIFLP
jgi:hypothetical protein